MSDENFTGEVVRGPLRRAGDFHLVSVQNVGRKKVGRNLFGRVEALGSDWSDPVYGFTARLYHRMRTSEEYCCMTLSVVTNSNQRRCVQRFAAAAP